MFFTETKFQDVWFQEWKFLTAEQDKWSNGDQNNIIAPLITRMDLDSFKRFHEASGFDEWQENWLVSLAPAFGVLQNFFPSNDGCPPQQANLGTD